MKTPPLPVAPDDDDDDGFHTLSAVPPLAAPSNTDVIDSDVIDSDVIDSDDDDTHFNSRSPGNAKLRHANPIPAS